MEKRYQVFISSTSKDLQPARKEVSEALLKSNCFPAQMELWGAVDAETFEFIKEVINQSDYLVLISAGMYGSIHPETGLSYTEMEFDYAVEIGKPIIRLLHKDPFNVLTGDSIEPSDEGKEKLKSFRRKLEDGKLCEYWNTPKDLKAAVILGLIDLKRRHEAVGWLPASQIASDPVISENLQLRKKVSDQNSRDKITKQILGSSSFPVWDALIAKSKQNEFFIDGIELLRRLESNGFHSFEEVSMIACSVLREKPLADAIIAAMEADKILSKSNSGQYFLGVEGKRLLRMMMVERVLDD